MKYTVLGIGAGGNKGAINLIEKGIISRDYVKLFNTTLKDVPDDYKNIAVHFASELGGSGKERNTGYNAEYFIDIVEALGTDAVLYQNEKSSGISYFEAESGRALLCPCRL